jgi:hypothetical protein
VWLILSHPEMIQRTCEECQKYVYQDTIEEMSSEKLIDKRTSLPLLRPPGGRLPCQRCPRVAHVAAKDKHPGNAVDIMERTWKIYRHYRECRAVGQFPDDPIVRSHAAEIRAVEDQLERREERQLLQTIVAMLTKR